MRAENIVSTIEQFADNAADVEIRAFLLHSFVIVLRL